MGRCKCPFNIKLSGTGTVGPKGQIVIPKEIRDILDAKPGDSFVFLVESGKFIGMVRNEDVSDLMEYLQDEGKDEQK